MKLTIFLEILKTTILPAFVGIITYLITKKIDLHNKEKEEIREIQRKRYEEFIDEMEDALEIGLPSVKNSSKQIKVQRLIHQKLNKLTGKMFISAPDEIVKLINESFNGQFLAEKRRPIYYEMRKKLLGKTSLKKEDLLWWSKDGKYN